MDRLSQIALAMTPGLGATGCRRLLAACPDTDIFALPKAQLAAMLGPSHHEAVDAIAAKACFAQAEAELRFCEANNIRTIFCADADYPERMNHEETQDCPALLYVLGGADLAPEHALAVVGTRRATTYGRDTAATLVHQLRPLGATIVSGLAYGIDTAAHRAALDNGLPTVAVLGHGLDRLYPPENRTLAQQIVQQGGALVTEYPSGTAINPRYFPARNRIIAALADATVVVEASEKGGALITASIAASYQREVFAVPGRLGDKYSCGTNNLIAINKAQLMRDAADIAYHMGWPYAGSQGSQQELFVSLDPDEQQVVDLLHKHSSLTLDEIVNLCGRPRAKVTTTLFDLEMQKVVRALPGRLYELVRNPHRAY